MENTAISIITPCYNQAPYIAETIESVIAQSFSEWELVIIDDGSTDNSAEIVKKYIEIDSRIHYFYQENAGPSAARNYGAKMSNGKFLLFLDGDNTISPNYLKIAYEYMESYMDCTLFTTYFDFIGDRNGDSRIRYQNYKLLLIENSIDCCSMMKKSDFISIGGFDENMRGYEDWELFIRLLYKNKKVHQEPQFLFHYRINNCNNSVNSIAKQKNNMLTSYIFTKHIDKYVEFFDSPQYIIKKYEELLQFNNYLIESNSYKIGRLITSPFRWIKRQFQ